MMTYKLLIGLVLTSFTVFSLFEFGQGIKILFSKIENGLGYHIVSFGSFSFFGLLFLYLFFRKSHKKLTGTKNSNSELIDLQLMGIHFVEGMLQGYNTYEQTKKTEPNEFLKKSDQSPQ